MMGFRAAEGYATLELWPEVIEELEDLPAVLRTAPAVLRLELRASVSLADWQRGMEIATRLGTMGSLDRMMAAGFYATLAREFFRQGSHGDAKSALLRAVESWPSCKEVVMKDPGLVAAIL
jgi:lipopolysaccharide biosynthesis regulator YciM